MTPVSNSGTYQRLLDFSNRLLEFLAPHGAEDMIDVQSFIWVVTGEYGPAKINAERVIAADVPR
jgi:hypothetical protein